MASNKPTKKIVDKKDVKKANTKVAAKTTKKVTKKVEAKKVTKKVTPKKVTKKVPTKTVAKTTKKVEPKKDITKKVTAKKVEPKKVIKKDFKKDFKKLVSKIEMKNTKYTIFLVLIVIVCLLLIANIVLLYKGNKAEIVNGNDIVLSMDGRTITADEYFEELKEGYGVNTLVQMADEYIASKELSDTDVDNANTQANTELEDFKAQLVEYEMDFDDYILENFNKNSEAEMLELILSYTKQNIVIENYVSAQITDEDIQTYYDENIFDSFDAKHILITPVTTEEMTDEEIADAENDALELATSIIEKLDNGENWTDLVTEYSDDEGSVPEDGLIENFTKGEVVDEFYAATVTLEDNAYTKEPVKSTYGYHIILRISNNGRTSFDESKDTLKEEIITSNISADANIYTTVFKELRTKYEFDIKDTELENSYKLSIGE